MAPLVRIPQSRAARRIAAVLATAGALLAATVAPASADLNPERIQMWPTSGTRICDAYANYVAVDANAKTAGQGWYKFRYTIMKDGANRFYSTMQGPWDLLAWTNYAMGAWNDYPGDIPAGAGVRAWLFKLINGVWQPSAYKTIACFTPSP